MTVILSHSLPAGRVCFLDSLGLEAKQASLKLVNVLIFFSPAHTLVNSPFTELSPVCVLSSFSHVQHFSTPWTIAHQAPLYLGFFRQEFWDALPLPPPGDLPDPRIEPTCPVLLVDSSPLNRWGSPNCPQLPYSSLPSICHKKCNCVPQKTVQSWYSKLGISLFFQKKSQKCTFQGYCGGFVVILSWLHNPSHTSAAPLCLWKHCLLLLPYSQQCRGKC